LRRQVYLIEFFRDSLYVYLGGREDGVFSSRLDAKDVGDKSALDPDASEVKSFCRSVFTVVLVGVGTHTVVLEARA